MKIIVELTKRQTSAFKAQAKLLHIPLEEFANINRQAMSAYLDQVLGHPDHFAKPETPDYDLILSQYTYPNIETARRAVQSLVKGGLSPEYGDVLYYEGENKKKATFAEMLTPA